MSDAPAWRDLFVSTDEAGRAALESAARTVIESLAREHAGPRTSLTPAELHEAVWSLEVCPEAGVAMDAVVAQLGRAVWSNGVVTEDPAAVAHLHPPTLLAAVATELAIAATNQSMDSWDQAPAATEVELHLMSWLAGLVGFADGSGIMTSGGTASNLLAITLARSSAARQVGVDVLQEGLPATATSWRVLCSDQAHFSVQRAAAQLGLGRDAVVAVATDGAGALDANDLDRTLLDLDRRGLETIALVATAGTTDLGAIDPLSEMARRARERGAWFHVDAAVAGSFLLSTRLAARVAGLELADSVTVDFHKLWWQPFNASALVLRDAGHFDLLRVPSSYLDRGDELEGMVNLVGRSLDTSRRFDAAKVLASLRTVGRARFAAMLEHVVDLASYAGAVVEAHPRLGLLAMPSAVMCVFDAPGASAEQLRLVQQRLLSRGEMVLGRTVVKGRPALKFTFMNPLTTEADVDRLVALVVAELDAV